MARRGDMEPPLRFLLRLRRPGERRWRWCSSFPLKMEFKKEFKCRQHGNSHSTAVFPIYPTSSNGSIRFAVGMVFSTNPFRLTRCQFRIYTVRMWRINVRTPEFIFYLRRSRQVLEPWELLLFLWEGTRLLFTQSSNKLWLVGFTSGWEPSPYSFATLGFINFSSLPISQVFSYLTLTS